MRDDLLAGKRSPSPTTAGSGLSGMPGTDGQRSAGQARPSDGSGPSRRPIAPGLIRQLPMRHTATIYTHDGWWFKYTVSRLHGIGIPEAATSHHRTLKGARRAVRRWQARDARQPRRVE